MCIQEDVKCVIVDYDRHKCFKILLKPTCGKLIGTQLLLLASSVTLSIKKERVAVRIK